MTCIADETQFHDPCILMLQTQCKSKKQCSAATRIFIHWINETDALGLYLPRDTPRYMPHALDHNGLALWMVIMDI